MIFCSIYLVLTMHSDDILKMYICLRPRHIGNRFLICLLTPYLVNSSFAMASDRQQNFTVGHSAPNQIVRKSKYDFLMSSSFHWKGLATACLGNPEDWYTLECLCIIRYLDTYTLYIDIRYTYFVCDFINVSWRKQRQDGSPEYAGILKEMSL